MKNIYVYYILTSVVGQLFSLGAENDNVSQCGLKCDKTAARNTFLI